MTNVNCIVQMDKVSNVKAKLANLDPVEAAQMFKVLSDETRVKIVYALSIEDELCVCDVAAIIDASNAAASHHLRLLRNLGIAKYRKEGRLVYYSLVDPRVKELVQKTFAFGSEEKKVGSFR